MAAKRRPPTNAGDNTSPDCMRTICRNVIVGGNRTSIRMEPLLWDYLQDIATREGHSINDIVTLIDERRGNSALTAALRIFILSYFRSAANMSRLLPSGLEEPPANFGERPRFSDIFRRAVSIFDRKSEDA
jgi:predicted DNA-binding ribbon-helix-helix protein